MSDTPRTDGVIETAYGDGKDELLCRMTELARQLERELAAKDIHLEREIEMANEFGRRANRLAEEQRVGQMAFDDMKAHYDSRLAALALENRALQDAIAPPEDDCGWPMCLCQPHDCCDGMEALCEEQNATRQAIDLEAEAKDYQRDKEAERGLYDKYAVVRLGDVSGKHEHCKYYVLDLDHDKYAAPALEAYASVCKKEYPALAADLRAKALTICERHFVISASPLTGGDLCECGNRSVASCNLLNRRGDCPNAGGEMIA